jgi:hypothetical protein
MGFLTVSVVLCLIGGVLLLLGIVGPIKIKYIMIPINSKYRFSFFLLGFLLIGGGIALELSRPPMSPTTITLPQPPNGTEKPRLNGIGPIRSKYSFEDGLMGWIVQDYQDSRACVQVADSAEQAKEGSRSLKLSMDLIGGDAHKSKGEAWVNFLDNPPRREQPPLDFTGKTVTASVYAPPGSRGEQSRPNGMQLFVKDENWKSEYGPWQNVVEGTWTSITLPISKSDYGDRLSILLHEYIIV